MNLDSPVTARQAVTIVSRALCVLCLLEAMVNLSYFPGYIGSLTHYVREMHGSRADSNYLLSYYVRNMAAATVRLAIDLFFALWFYRADEGPLKFLLKEKEPT